MTSVELATSQLPALSELNSLLAKIEKETAISVDHTTGEDVAYHLMRRIELQHHTPRIMELATMIYDHCKGMVAVEAMSEERILNLKQDIQRKYFEGRLAKWNALYAKAERTCKDLNASMDGLRSILSREKELMKNQAA